MKNDDEISWWELHKEGYGLFFANRIEFGYDLTDWALPIRIHDWLCFHVLCFYVQPAR